MKIEIVYNNTYYEINPERIALDERLDEVLDSLKFCFMSNVLTTDIPPFTKAVITDGNITTYYYCSTTCNEIVEMPGYYYHVATLVEATKILETFVIGTKSFSVINDDELEDYNRNSGRLEVLNNIVLNEYGYTIILSPLIQEGMYLKREYSFGAGSTYFDIALEILKTQNYLPYVSYISDDGRTIILDAQSLNIRTNVITQINTYSKVTKTQSVDEYCSDVVTEMDSVADRNNITTCIITPRSTSETIYKDNALLRLPTNVESIKNLYILLDGYTGPTCKIPASMLDFSGDSSYDNDKLSTANLNSWIETYSANSTIEQALKNWVYMVENLTGHSHGYYDQAVVFWQKDDYCLLLLWNSAQYADHEEDWVSIGVLNKENWSLLTTDEQPAFIYYDTDTNIIDGFNNFKNNDFWNSMIWGSKGPFLKEYFKQGSDSNYQRTLKYTDFDDKSTSYFSLGYTFEYILSYHMYYPIGNNSPSTNILDYRWKVEYYPKCHIGASESKTIQPENELSWKKTTRSYNNGANTVDYNLLIPAMRKSANMLGLEIKSVESLEDLEVGKRTQFGYIVSKQTNFNIYNGEKVINNIVYNCCQNYQQIAQAIGINTQYEATNVPSNGIVTRYITIKKQVDLTTFNNIANDDCVLYFALETENGGLVSKPCTRLVYDDAIYLVCETEDNYTFDYAKVNSSTEGYYKRDPVPYSDKNQCIGNKRVTLFSDYDRFREDRNNSMYDSLPRYTFGTQVFSLDNIYIGKDSRERLIFQYKIIKS